VSPGTRDGGRRAAGFVLAAAAAGAVLLLWWVFVNHPGGRRLEQVAYEGSSIGRTRLEDSAQQILDVVSVPFLAVVIVVGMSISLIRGRGRDALAVAVVVAGANVTTQVLKYHVLERPDFTGAAQMHWNSLPSGHTTVAATVGAAALLATVPRWRWLATLLGFAYAGGTGISTMIGGWHRASDVVAAFFVVVAWILLVSAVLRIGGDPVPAGTPSWMVAADRYTRRLFLVVGLAAGFAALLSLMLTTQSDGSSRAELLIAYGGASVGVLSVACLTAFVALWFAGPRPASPRPRG